jgi:hypothetical protein
LSDASGAIVVIVTVFNIGDRTDYYIDPESATFTGDGDWVDAQSTPQLFELMARTAISEGLELGYSTCNSDCGLLNPTTRVYAPACVKRTGTGLETKFSSCTLNLFSMREYTVCCPSGIEAPVTDLVFKTVGGLCVGESCESTCP